MHPLVRNVEYAVRGALPIRAEALSVVSLFGNTCLVLPEFDQLTESDSYPAIKKRSLKVEL